MSSYSKPHLTYEQQIAMLRSRGLGIPDEESAVRLLQQVGYYRLTGYWYPYREMNDPEVAAALGRRRRDQFVPDVTLDHVQEIFEFDRQLRLLCLDGLERFEIALRAAIAYELGAVDPFLHLDDSQLDRKKCGERRPRTAPETELQKWKRSLERDVQDSKREDFVIHFKENYDGQMPIWVLTEAMKFGTLVRLLHLLKGAQANAVAGHFGIPSGSHLHSISLGLNTLRNIAAHHNRLWNRSFGFQPLKVGTLPGVDQGWSHFDTARDGRIYRLLGSLALTLTAAGCANGWASQVADLVESFPDVPLLSPTPDMGFPEDWRDQSVWRSPTD